MDSFSFSKIKGYLPTNGLSMPSMSDLKASLPQLSGTRTPPEEGSFDWTERHSQTHNGLVDDAPGPKPEAANPQLLEPRPIDDSKPKSNLDLVAECDSFPYLHASPDRYFRHVNHYYHLEVRAYPGLCLGYVLPSVVGIFNGVRGWEVDDDERKLVLVHGDTPEERSEVVAMTFAAMRELNHFAILKKWRNEPYTVHGPRREVLFTVERAASALLGVVTYGAHLTAYIREKRESKDGNAEGVKDDGAAPDAGKADVIIEEQKEIKIWVPRRAKSKDTYGGMLDNTVAGGMAAGEQPLECLLREAMEEASLPDNVLRPRCRAAGTVSYFHIRDARAGGETGLLQPECQYVYDADLTGLDVKPKPEDGEVDEFLLLTVDEVQDAMRKGEFKPNTALVLLDFFVRHGILTAENENDYAEITSRLHRVTDFPLR